jgi:hypothetical protein
MRLKLREAWIEEFQVKKFFRSANTANWDAIGPPYLTSVVDRTFGNSSTDIVRLPIEVAMGQNWFENMNIVDVFQRSLRNQWIAIHLWRDVRSRQRERLLRMIRTFNESAIIGIWTMTNE